MSDINSIEKQVEKLLNSQLKVCPVCGSNTISHIETTVWKKVAISYSICDRCSIVFQNPRMDEPNTTLFYEKYYRLFHEGDDAPTEEQLAYQGGRSKYFEQRLKPFINEMRETGSFLDIGSSGGLMLKMINEKFSDKLDVFGIEPGNAYREFSIREGFKVFENTDSLVNAFKGKFNLVTISHVLEHTSDPVAFLKDIRDRLLVEGGNIMIEVPNFMGHYSFELPHNFCFTKTTLLNVIHLAGFKNVSLITHAKPNRTLIPLYLNIVIKPSAEKSVLKRSPAWAVKIKRRIAPTHHSKLSAKFLNYLKRGLVKVNLFK